MFDFWLGHDNSIYHHEQSRFKGTLNRPLAASTVEGFFEAGISEVGSLMWFYRGFLKREYL